MSRVAAIDCGTNSIRLLVADVTAREDGSASLRDVHRETRIVRLGQDVDATGRLAPEALARTRAALVDYAAVARRAGVERVRMVATSATRDAANREDFFSMVHDTLGTDAEVISGDEEARLSFTGAVGDLDPADGPFVVVDVGGGSTEVVLGEWDGIRADVQAARSVDVGCVRITERHLRADPPSEEDVGSAEAFARQTLAGAFAEVAVQKARTWVGVAGTVTTLSAIAQEQNRQPSRLPCAEPKVDRRPVGYGRGHHRWHVSPICPGTTDRGSVSSATRSDTRGQRAGGPSPGHRRHGRCRRPGSRRAARNSTNTVVWPAAQA